MEHRLHHPRDKNQEVYTIFSGLLMSAVLTYPQEALYLYTSSSERQSVRPKGTKLPLTVIPCAVRPGGGGGGGLGGGGYGGGGLGGGGRGGALGCGEGGGVTAPAWKHASPALVIKHVS